MAQRWRVTIAQLRAAEALIERAELMGRPIRVEVLERARDIVRMADEDGMPTRAQKPIGNPA